MTSGISIHAGYAAASRSVLLAVLIVTLLFVATFSLLAPHYETNDDAHFSLMVAGVAVATSPDEHIYSNILIGRLLKAAYQARPEWPWYAAYLIGVQWLAHVALLYTVLRQASRRVPLVLYGFYFVSVGIYFLTSLQFTTTAFMAGQSGAALFLHWFTQAEESLPCRVRGELAASLICLIIAGMIRKESLYLALILTLPPLAIVAASPWRARRTMLALAALGAMAGASTALDRYDRSVYEDDPEWKWFWRHALSIAAIIDYQTITYESRTKPAFEQLGWTESDFDLLRNWFFIDKATYNPDKIEALASLSTNRRATNVKYAIGAIRIVFVEIFKSNILSFSMLAVMAVALQQHLARRRRIGLIVSALSGLALVCGLVAFRIKTPERVVYPMLTFSFAMLPWFYENKSQNRIMERRFTHGTTRRMAMCNVAAIVAGVVFSSLSLMNHYRVSCNAMTANRNLRNDLDVLRGQNTRALVCWETAFPFEGIAPFGGLDALRGISLIHLGAYQQSVMTERVLRQLSIHDLCRSLTSDSSVLLVASPFRTHYLDKYISEHYGLSAKWQTEFSGRTFKGLRGTVESTVHDKHSSDFGHERPTEK